MFWELTSDVSTLGAQWLSSRMLDYRPRVCGFAVVECLTLDRGFDGSGLISVAMLSP